MSVSLRLSRGGSKKRPYYRIVAADIRSPRDGRYLERLGTYNPMKQKNDPERISLNIERIKYWLSQGAKPTTRVARLLGENNLMEMPKPGNNPNKAVPKKDRKKDSSDAPKEEKKAEAPKEEKKAEAPKDEKKSDAPKEEKKTEAPKAEKKAEAPKEEKKADAPKAENKAEAPKEEKKK